MPKSDIEIDLDKSHDSFVTIFDIDCKLFILIKYESNNYIKVISTP